MDASTALTSIGLGVVASASPCVLPLYPGFLAYLALGTDRRPLGRGRYLLGVFILAGVLTMMLLLGLVLAALSIAIGRALSVVIPVADLLLLTFGILLLVDRNPFQRFPQLRAPVVSHPYAGAFLYGLLYGPIAFPCSGPLVVGLFAFSLTAGQALDQLSVFLWFGVGFGLPLLMLSFASAASQRHLTRLFARHARAISWVGGAMLVAVAAYDLWSNWEFLRPYLQ
ncbi:MAG TPA: cytochrome c biogenesis protein CcdA [Anaerolineales bacterium]|nr:cytochrome c biogenesis protein CcdA [Anaerolineales bacterium]